MREGRKGGWGSIPLTSSCSSSSSSSSLFARNLQCSATICNACCLRSSFPLTFLPPSRSTHLRKGKQNANAGADRSSVNESDELDPTVFRSGTDVEWRTEITRLVADNKSSSHQAWSIRHIGFKSRRVTYPTSSADVEK